MVQEGARVCLGKSISHVSISAMFGKRSSGYVKDNDVRYGLKVAYCDPKSSKVTGLQCRFCIAFGWEEKVGSKCKAATIVQGWSHPFRYDNIENHLRNQHFGQWALYQALESSFEHVSFFNDVLVAFKNFIKAHFLSIEGAGLGLGLSNSKLTWILVGVITLIWVLYFIYSTGLPEGDDDSSLSL